MKYLIILILCTSSALAKVTVTAKGKWRINCNGVQISTHVTYYKSFEATVNEGVDCDIIPPDRYEVRVDHTVIEPSIIKLSWDYPKFREDGTSLSLNEIKSYAIYDHQVLIQTVPGHESSTQVHATEGSHSYTISTIDSNQNEGQKSDALVADNINDVMIFDN